MGTTDTRSHRHDGAARVAVSIAAASTPVLSSALAHNRVPVVSRLALTTHGGPLRGATVRLGVRDTEGPIGSPVELTVDLDAEYADVVEAPEALAHLQAPPP